MSQVITGVSLHHTIQPVRFPRTCCANGQCANAAGLGIEDTAIINFLQGLNNLSAVGDHLQHLLRETEGTPKRSRGASWHHEAHLHALLGRYLSHKFPHGTSKNVPTIEKAQLLLDIFEHRLYPWIPNQHSSSLEWKKSLVGRALVTCVSSHYFDIALTNLKGLRKVFGVGLPIYVCHADENDLAVQHQLQLQNIEDIFTINLSEIYTLQLGGWQLKPFAMLACGAAEVIWFDADLIFLENPEGLFDNQEYDETGVLLFHDRTVSNGLVDLDWKWVKDLIGGGSDYLQSSHAFVGEAGHIVDSSAIVMHISRNLFAMLVIAQLNVDPDTYNHVYGDKETFWLGFEILDRPWSMNEWGMSGVTFSQRQDSKCSGQPLSGAQASIVPACGHMGPQGTVQMIHFSASKDLGPAPFTTLPVGYIPTIGKHWDGLCVQFEDNELRKFSRSHMQVYQQYMSLHTQMDSAHLHQSRHMSD